MRCSVSIDVDPISCYYRIHGLGTPPERVRDIVLHRCVPRFAQLFSERGLRATFFIVARDIDAGRDRGVERSREVLRALVGDGHEIGNHSYSHPYDLARLPPRVVGDEIERAHQVLGEALGVEVCGFRAPGYDVSATMLSHLARLGYRYDSSIFPAPGYYAAKAVVMAGLSVIGRKSGAVMTNPRALIAPTTPYRPDLRAPWRRGDASVVELPIAVTPGVRIPAIGTSLLAAPDWVRQRLLSSVLRTGFFNFELHGIDLADAHTDDLPAELVARQPDLRLPLEVKRARLQSTLDAVTRAGEVVLLREHAAAVQRAQ